MQYNNIKSATFISRPNRFIANILVDNVDGVNSKEEICHVKNTGRCKELLTKGCRIFVEENNNPNRRTKYDLISVYKGDRLINMDSQAPNKAFHKFLLNSDFIRDIKLIKPECTFGNSRFDFYIEAGERRIFAEIKGVTLEENNVVLFPDAPTQRGVKHINELVKCIEQGFEAYIIFIVQMENVDYFTPNVKTHIEFANALSIAEKCGVNICAFDCIIDKNSIVVNQPVPIKLNSKKL